MTKIELVNGSEIALVQVNNDGRVEVVREGMGTETLNAKYTFETAVKKFEENGWKSQTLEAAMKNNIPLSLQQEVDEYLEIHAQKAELEAKLTKLKGNIKGYMDSNNLKAIPGSKGKQIYLQDAAASNSTALYSNYELAPVLAALNGNNEILRQVTEVRVNSDKLEAMLKVGNLANSTVEEIKSLKIVKTGTPRFSVKK